MESRIEDKWNQEYRIHGIKDTKYMESRREYMESRMEEKWNQKYRIHGIKDTKYMESRIENIWNQG